MIDCLIITLNQRDFFLSIKYLKILNIKHILVKKYGYFILRVENLIFENVHILKAKSHIIQRTLITPKNIKRIN